MSEKTIALLGQPNSGKSTLFNGLTGSRQHVGNWPGKTVERKDGSFVHKDTTYKIIDLPGTYSLSANSDEEVVTRNYIASGQADVVCILADASQLNRSLFMLADYTGIRVPVVLLLNMMDVAKSQGKQIDTNGIAKSLTSLFGLPWQLFIAFVASAMGKEASLGVMASLFNTGSIWAAIEQSATVDTAALSTSMLSVISRPEALAFLFAFFFNMPCLMALTATTQETHSMKWTVRIALYYVLTALIMATIAYHVGLVIF